MFRGRLIETIALYLGDQRNIHSERGSHTAFPFSSTRKPGARSWIWHLFRRSKLDVARPLWCALFLLRFWWFALVLLSGLRLFGLWRLRGIADSAFPQQPYDSLIGSDRLRHSADLQLSCTVGDVLVDQSANQRALHAPLVGDGDELPQVICALRIGHTQAPAHPEVPLGDDRLLLVALSELQPTLVARIRMAFEPAVNEDNALLARERERSKGLLYEVAGRALAESPARVRLSRCVDPPSMRTREPGRSLARLRHLF